MEVGLETAPVIRYLYRRHVLSVLTTTKANGMVCIELAGRGVIRMCGFR